VTAGADDIPGAGEGVVFIPDMYERQTLAV